MNYSDGVNLSMPVTPVNNGGGFGGFGNDGWWIILLLLCGWGGMGGMGYGAPMMAAGMMGGEWGLYPWLNQSNQINDGFQRQMMAQQMTSIGDKVASGFGDMQTALCGGFAGVTAAVNGAQAAVSQQLYSNQIADMERSFAAQTAQMQSANAMQAQLAQAANDNRAATADLKYTVANENCADRTQAMQNTRDIIDSNTRNTQAVLDKLCALELDGLKSQLAAERREAENLRTELMYARGQASQIEQTAQLRAGQNEAVNSLYSRLSSCPVPCQPVYGNQPIFSCGGNNMMGCGCAGAVA